MFFMLAAKRKVTKAGELLDPLLIDYFGKLKVNNHFSLPIDTSIFSI